MNLKDLLQNSPHLTNITDFVVNSTIDGIRALDLNNNYILINPALERISGYKQEDLLGKNAFEFFPFLKDLGEEEIVARAAKGETIYVSEQAYDIPERNRKGYFEAIYAPLYDNEQKIVGTFCLVRDVSEIKRTSMALNETEQKLRSLSHVVNDGLVTCNKNGEILSWNKGAENIFGYCESEALKLSISVILPDFQWQTEIRRLRSLDNLDRNIRVEGVRKNQSAVSMEVSRSRWNIGAETYLSLGLKDLSDFKHLENQANEFRDIGEALLEVHNDLHQGIIAMDSQTTRVVYANQAFLSMTGFTTEELLNAPDYLKPLRRQVVMELGTKIHRNEISNFFEVTLSHKLGGIFRVDAAARQVETSYGLITLFILRAHSKEATLTRLKVLE